MLYRSKVAPKIVSTSLIFACLPAQAVTYYVDDQANCTTADGSTAKPFCTIQAAVHKAAASGDTVQVAHGDYDPVDIKNKSLKLLGANPTTTAINGYDYGVKVSGFASSAPGRVEIANFAIVGVSGNTTGIWAESGYLDVNVHNCVLSNNAEGIYAKSANVGVTNSVITSNNSGVYVYTAYAQVTSNIIMHNEKGIECGYGGSFASSYNTYFENTTNRVGCSGATTRGDKDNIDPLLNTLNTDYTLQSGSPAIDAGSPVPSERDPDGSGNDQGIYGGPGAAVFLYPNLPTVTNLFITPSAVNSGGTFSIQATGQAQ